MTPEKQKALSIMASFQSMPWPTDKNRAKANALITVEEIMNTPGVEYKFWKNVHEELHRQ